MQERNVMLFFYFIINKIEEINKNNSIYILFLLFIFRSYGRHRGRPRAGDRPTAGSSG